MDVQNLGRRAADLGQRAGAFSRRVLDMVQTKGRTMIGPLLGWLITPLGRWAAIAAFAVVTWASVAVHYETKGASRVTAKIEKRIEQHAQTANAERARANTLSPSGLRDAFTRD